jgi:hypothetical protein
MVLTGHEPGPRVASWPVQALHQNRSYHFSVPIGLRRRDAPCRLSLRHQYRKDSETRDQTPRTRLDFSDRRSRPRSPACQASASSAEGEGLCGNLFSYRSIADWIFSMSAGVRVIGYQPSHSHHTRCRAGSVLLNISAVGFIYIWSLSPMMFKPRCSRKLGGVLLFDEK